MKPKSLQELATKQELKEEISALEARIDIKMEKLEQKIDDKARKYRDEVLTVMDFLSKQLKEIHEEQVIMNKHSEDMWVKINSHESRITKLEKIQHN